MALFSKVKGKEAKAVLMNLLTFVATETRITKTPVLAPKNVVDQIMLAEKDLIEVVNAIPDGAGNVQVRITDTGAAAFDTSQAPKVSVSEAGATSGVTLATASSYTVEDGFEVPPSKRGGAYRTSPYPFETMQVKQSFFIPNTEARPNVAKSMASTVSGINKRFAKNGKPNKFTVRARTVADGEKTAGARVYRIA
jgi:hypothetical protein